MKKNDKNKKPIARVVIFLAVIIVSEGILLSVFTPKVYAFSIVGDSVEVNTSKIYFKANPHTLRASNDWIYYDLMSKQFSGNIDIAWGFDTSQIRPQEIEYYYNNKWVNANKLFDPVSFEYGGMNKWYVFDNWNINAEQMYSVRAKFKIVEFPLTTKYWVCAKPSALTFGEAVGSGNLLCLDPWANATFPFRTEINLSMPIGQSPDDFQVFIEFNSTDNTELTNFSYSEECHTLQNTSRIRFFNGSNNAELPFWIEDCDGSGESVKVWVKSDQPLPSDGTYNIWMYYGYNESTFTTDMENTFAGNEINTNKLETGDPDGQNGLVCTAGTVVQDNSFYPPNQNYFQEDVTDFLTCTKNFQDVNWSTGNKTMMYWMKKSDTPQTFVRVGNAGDTNFNIYWRILGDEFFDWYNGAGWQDNIFSIVTEQIHKIEFKCELDSQTCHIYLDGQFQTTRTSTNSFNFQRYAGIYCGQVGGSENCFISSIVWREYYPYEPIVVFNPQEEQNATPPTPPAPTPQINLSNVSVTFCMTDHILLVRNVKLKTNSSGQLFTEYIEEQIYCKDGCSNKTLTNLGEAGCIENSFKLSIYVILIAIIIFSILAWMVRK